MRATVLVCLAATAVSQFVGGHAGLGSVHSFGHSVMGHGVAPSPFSGHSVPGIHAVGAPMIAGHAVAANPALATGNGVANAPVSTLASLAHQQKAMLTGATMLPAAGARGMYPAAGATVLPTAGARDMFRSFTADVIGEVATTCPEGSIANADNNVCCPASCGTCGGQGCAQRKGGESNCCRENIQASKIDCAITGEAPCALENRANMPGTPNFPTANSAKVESRSFQRSFGGHAGVHGFGGTHDTVADLGLFQHTTGHGAHIAHGAPIPLPGVMHGSHDDGHGLHGFGHHGSVHGGHGSHGSVHGGHHGSVHGTGGFFGHHGSVHSGFGGHHGSVHGGFGGHY